MLCGAEYPKPLAGGGTDEEGQRQVDWTLDRVVKGLRNNGISNDDITYVAGPTAFVDKNGKIYSQVPKGIPLDGYYPP